MKRLTLYLMIFLIFAFLFQLSYIQGLDNMIVQSFEQIRTWWLTDFFLILTNIGSIKVALPITLIFVAIFLFKKRLIEPIFLMINFFLVRNINYVIKEVYARERPAFDSVIDASHFSFPSGHTMNSTAIYGLIILLFQKTIRQKKLRYLLNGIGILFILLIGLSRLYLGVHYLTDILAGFVGGLFVLYLSWKSLNYTKKKIKQK